MDRSAPGDAPPFCVLGADTDGAGRFDGVPDAIARAEGGADGVSAAVVPARDASIDDITTVLSGVSVAGVVGNDVVGWATVVSVAALVPAASGVPALWRYTMNASAAAASPPAISVTGFVLRGEGGATGVAAWGAAWGATGVVASGAATVDAARTRMTQLARMAGVPPDAKA